MKKRLFCKRPDRDVPGIICGFPLPCPYHTATIDMTTEPPTVKVPIIPDAPGLKPKTLRQLKKIAQVLTEDK